MASLLEVSPADLEPAAVAQRVQQAAHDAAAARALAPREAERLELAGRLRDLEALRLAAADAVAELAVRAEAEPRELEALRERAGAARAVGLAPA